LSGIKNILKSTLWGVSFKLYSSLFGTNFSDVPVEKWKGENECEAMAGYTRTFFNVIGLKAGVSRFLEPRRIGHSEVECRRHAWLTIKKVGDRVLEDPIVVDPTIWQFLERKDVSEESKVGAFYVGKQSEYFELLRPKISIVDNDYSEDFDPQFRFFSESKKPEGAPLERKPLFGWNFSSKHLKKGVDVLALVDRFDWRTIAFPVLESGPVAKYYKI